jgi:hypothetical protein
MTLHIQLRRPPPALHPNPVGWHWGGVMNFGQRFTLLLAALLLSGCSKTVTWEEEVPLNTGEVIWVTRIVTYKLVGASGNPLDIDYRPDWTETLEFTWQGKVYSYTGDAALMLLAISPKSLQPVLVAKASSKQWSRQYDYRCTTPFYVQFVPAHDGRKWSWPPNIEPWLFGLPYNIMQSTPGLQEGKNKYSSDQRLERDRVIGHQSPSLVRVESNYIFNQCKK